MSKMNENVYPEILRIRDTGLHDDLGGAGQRIYTTAGQGYAKVRYIREDIANERMQFMESILDVIKDMLSGPLTGEDAYAVFDYLTEIDAAKERLR